MAGTLLGLVTYGVVQLRGAHTGPPAQQLGEVAETQVRKPGVPERSRVSAGGRPSRAATQRVGDPRASEDFPSAEAPAGAAPVSAAFVKAPETTPSLAPKKAGPDNPSLFDEADGLNGALGKLRDGRASESDLAGEGVERLDQLMKEILSSVSPGGPDGASASTGLTAQDQEQVVREFIEIQRLPPEAQATRMKDLARRMGVSSPALSEVDAAMEQ